jgi:DNA-binding transcriptional regulator YhcF (GntR family)
VATLAKYAGVDARNVRKALRELEAAGEIVTARNGGGMRRQADHTRPNLYTFTLGCPDECDRSTNHHINTP